jgi:hypothetical protein
MSIRSRISGLAMRAMQPTDTQPAAVESAAYKSGVAAILAQKAARQVFRRLWDAEVSVSSQWGEDGILDFLCDFLDLPKPKAVEFGAGNFSECNTRFLADYRSASVMAIDARDDLLRTVASMQVNWRTTVLPRQKWITPATAPVLLKEAQMEFGGVDIVSIDIDGNDYWVAKSLPLEGVTVVIVEYNPLFGPRHPVSVPRDDHFDRTQAHYSWLYHGASLRAYVALMLENEFTFLGGTKTGSNAFFVRSSELPGYPLEIPNLEDLSPFTDWRCRESRDRSGNMDFLSGHQRIAVMADLPLVNTVTGATLSVLGAHDNP